MAPACSEIFVDSGKEIWLECQVLFATGTVQYETLKGSRRVCSRRTVSQRQDDLVIAHQSYLICATQRTGSTLLCETLRQSKTMGVPREYFEYLGETGLPRQPTQYFIPCEQIGFNPVRVVEFLGSPKLRKDFERIAREERNGYQSTVCRARELGTTSNGVFGAKIMWDHLPDFLRRLTGDANLTSSQRVNTCLQATFPGLKYIYVTRGDKLRQAISLWKAIQTQQWRLDRATREVIESRAPIFDFSAVQYLQRRLAEHDRNWQSFFAAAELEPLVLRYEEFTIDLKRTFVRIARFLGITDDLGDCFALPSMIKQSNSQSERWFERYRSVARNRGRFAQGEIWRTGVNALE